VSLKHDTAMSGQRGVTGPNKQGWVYQGHDWPNETDEKGWHGKVPFDGPKELEDSQIDSKSSRWI
jgi:hypothetical protein